METPKTSLADNTIKGVSAMLAINIAKAITIVCLVVPSLLLDVHTTRVVIYLSLHVSYCVWWLLEQVLLPERGKQLFTERLGPFSVGLVILYVGIFYAVPGWLAMANPEPILPLTMACGIVLYIFGSLINTTADVQKMTAKQHGDGLVADGIWRRVRHVNYSGDIMRYSSFAVIAGSVWAWLLPLSVLLLYVFRILDKEKSMAQKYHAFAAYQEASWRLLPGIW